MRKVEREKQFAKHMIRVDRETTLVFTHDPRVNLLTVPTPGQSWGVLVLREEVEGKGGTCGESVQLRK